MTTSVSLFKKIESEHKTKYDTFFHTQMQKQLSMKITFMMYLNQSILEFYHQTYKNLKEKAQARLLIQS